MNRLFAAVALMLALALPAHAQQLKLQITDGRVTLDAANVPVRQILAEWARVGGTKVVGAEKVTGAPLTLKLVDMPERQALDIILRNVAGFMAAPRLASAVPGASSYDKILIMATSAPAPGQAAGGRPTVGAPGLPPTSMPGGMAGTQRRVPPRPPNLPPSPADEASDEPEPEEQPVDTTTQPVFTFPAPQGNAGNPVFVPVNPNNAGAFGRAGQPGTVAAPVIQLQPNANGQPTIYNFVPNGEGQLPPPGPGGFTVIGSPTPGMIQQPTPPPAPGQPTPRPPGR